MVDDIRLKDDEIPAFTDGSGCQLCLKKLSKYTCPRCNVKYCSLECYRGRKHVQCSEMFYKKCVMDSLEGDTVDNHEKRKMMEILKRFEEEEVQGASEEEGDRLGENLEERLDGLNLDRDTQKIWEKLTLEEKKEFQRAVDDGYVGSLIDAWVPWWIESETSVEEAIKSETSSNCQLPKLLKNIPKLSSLIKSRLASDQTKYNLVNILYSYVYICRLYNGCHHEFLEKAVDGLWKLSAVLYHAINFSSLDAALCNAVETSQQHKELFNSEEFSLSVVDDVSLLLKSCEVDKKTHYVKLALSDVHRLLSKAIKVGKNSNETHLEGVEPKGNTKLLWLAKKKVLFVLAWFCENQVECSTLVPFLPVVKAAMAVDVKKLQEEKIQVQKSRKQRSGRKLIEELN